MARNDREPGGDPAVRDRDPRERGRGDRRADPGHDFVRNAGARERERLFATAAEDERIAALQAHDALAASRRLDHEALDALLRDGAASRALSDVEPPRARSEI